MGADSGRACVIVGMRTLRNPPRRGTRRSRSVRQRLRRKAVAWKNNPPPGKKIDGRIEFSSDEMT
eukprot:8141289-Pyramimonas_sp.AAC.2